MCMRTFGKGLALLALGIGVGFVIALLVPWRGRRRA